MKQLCVFWFTDVRQHFGIVVGEDDVTKETKAYIGACQPGGTEESDALYISQHGAKFLPEHAKTLNSYLNPEVKDETVPLH